ncbi:MAG: hypothetical protein DDT35_00422 [Firmicutes bacterium]|nr:hypothetical protein [Bacillota bacterium]
MANIEELAKVRDRKRSERLQDLKGNQELHRTDLGNAGRFAAQHGQDARFCHPWGKWLFWDGARWAMDESGEVYRRAKEAIKLIYDEASQAAVETDRVALAKHAIASESAARLKAMVFLAESETGIPVLPKDLDANPWALNCVNGTVDLKTGQLAPHRQEDLITKLAPVEYSPTAECPRWSLFLHEIMEGSRALVEYLQRAVGMSLTGDTSEHVLLILHGGGRNGKGTFMNIVLKILGDYACQAPPDLLMASRGDRHPTELADLHGRRFVSTSETGEGRHLAESLVKQLTGGDKIKGRRMREDFWEFWPTHKLWLATNHKPQVKGTDLAIWSRLHLVPFNVSYPDGDPRQDKKLPEKLEQEVSGILRWAVEGCLAWQRQGLGTPPEVKAATEAYRAEMDVFGPFFADCCRMSPSASISAATLYDAYKNWCTEEGVSALSQKKLGSALTKRDCQRKKDRTGRYLWKGIELADTPESLEFLE